jgi:bifunctional DNA-binding transcriptional regulator/antitoxin component of YhaV-PrlF toxin-antitoxin module
MDKKRKDTVNIMDTTIRICEEGIVSLPPEICEKYGLHSGDMLHLVDLDGLLVMVPMMPIVPRLAREIERLRLEAGISIEELLKGLQEERERYYREHYEYSPSA